MKGSLNPKILVAIAILAILAIVVFVLMTGKSKKAQVNTQVVPTTAPKANVFTSIKDALSQSLSLKCEYADNEGRKTVAYIKNGAIRGDMTGKTVADSGSVIVKDKKMYFWNDKSAITMQVPDVEVTNTPSAAGNASAGTSLLNSMEQYKEHCQSATVADSLFTPPANITFTDMSKLIPSNMPKISGGAVSQEEINKMMQQYKVTPPVQQ